MRLGFVEKFTKWVWSIFRPFCGFLGSHRSNFRPEEKFQDLAEHMGAVFWVYQPEERHQFYLSPAFEKIWRCDRKLIEENPQKRFDFIHPLDRQKYQSFVEIQSLQNSEVEYRIIRPDGELRWIYDRSFIVKTEKGELTHIAGIAEDITTRKLAEENVARKEAKFRMLAESLPQIVWIANADGSATYFNSQWEAETGMGSFEALGSGWVRALHPDEVGKVMAAWRKSVEEETPFEMEFRLRRPDSSFSWYLCRSTPTRSKKGEIIKWCGFAAPIDERRRTEEERNLLSEVKGLLASSLEFDELLAEMVKKANHYFSGWCVIHLKKEDGSIRIHSAAHRDPGKLQIVDELTREYPTRPDAPRGAANVIHTGEAEWAPSISEDLLRTVAVDDRHFQLVKEIGLRSYITVPIRTGSEVTGAITFARTDRSYGPNDFQLAKIIGQELSAALEKAELYRQTKEAVRIRDEFLSIASHELRTPITPLKMQLQMLRRQIKRLDLSSINLDPAVERFLREVDLGFEVSLRQIDKLTGLVDNLLDISRIRSKRLFLEKCLVDLRSVGRDILERYSNQIRASGIRVELEESPHAIPGHWDRMRLEQVISNLLSNALKYGRGRPVKLRILQDGGWGLIEVCDHGIGMSQDFLQRIFNPFERGVPDQQVSGLGLGLYITKQIVEAHGGQIRVQSERDQGTNFAIRLPMANYEESSAGVKTGT